MNAQSSRSHAIFSLTLTQKKYTGSGPPPRSSSPLPPHGRSPSRLARPGSMYQGGPGGSTRVSSPTFGRPATPSFASAIGRGGGGGLRPSSALGHAGDRSPHGGEDDAGEWVTIVSKFHFVDLAGSERVSTHAYPLRPELCALNSFPVEADCSGWGAYQGRNFHQRWTSSSRQCYLSSR